MAKDVIDLHCHVFTGRKNFSEEQLEHLKKHYPDLFSMLSFDDDNGEERYTSNWLN
jgi:hypothetical protein